MLSASFPGVTLCNCVLIEINQKATSGVFIAAVGKMSIMISMDEGEKSEFHQYMPLGMIFPKGSLGDLEYASISEGETQDLAGAGNLIKRIISTGDKNGYFQTEKDQKYFNQALLGALRLGVFQIDGKILESEKTEKTGWVIDDEKAIIIDDPKGSGFLPAVSTQERPSTYERDASANMPTGGAGIAALQIKSFLKTSKSAGGLTLDFRSLEGAVRLWSVLEDMALNITFWPTEKEAGQAALSRPLLLAYSGMSDVARELGCAESETCELEDLLENIIWASAIKASEEMARDLWSPLEYTDSSFREICVRDLNYHKEKLSGIEVALNRRAAASSGMGRDGLIGLSQKALQWRLYLEKGRFIGPRNSLIVPLALT